MIVKEALLVSLGAIFGASLRFFLLSYFQARVTKKYWATFFVNSIATFLLGLLLAVQTKLSLTVNRHQIVLFMGVGFLGSFSTFSTFIFEIFNLLRMQRLRELGWVLLASMGGGLLALLAGYRLGYG